MSKESGKEKFKTALQKEIEDKYSQHWQIYRLATHEKGGLHMVCDLETKISFRQMNKMLEILDVYDSLKEEAYEKAKREAEKNNPKS